MTLYIVYTTRPYRESNKHSLNFHILFLAHLHLNLQYRPINTPVANDYFISGLTVKMCMYTKYTIRAIYLPVSYFLFTIGKKDFFYYFTNWNL